MSRRIFNTITVKTTGLHTIGHGYHR